MDCESFVRSSQSLSLMKMRPEFWPVPAKLKPFTVSTPSTDVLLFVRAGTRCALSSAAQVRSLDAPGGVCTWP